MDHRAEIEIRERLTNVEARLGGLTTQQATNVEWISKLGSRAQHHGAMLVETHDRIATLGGKVKTLAEAEKINTRERERRKDVRMTLYWTATTVITLATLTGVISEPTRKLLASVIGG